MKRSQFLASLGAFIAASALFFTKKKVNPNPTLDRVLKSAGFPDVRNIKSVSFGNVTYVKINGKILKVTESNLSDNIEIENKN